MIRKDLNPYKCISGLGRLRDRLGCGGTRGLILALLRVLPQELDASSPSPM